jgi:hypothetical protein
VSAGTHELKVEYYENRYDALARVSWSGGDTTPPTVVSTTPTNGSTGAAVGVSPTATFSEAMDTSTLTTSTFTLRQQGQTTPVSATVSYASQVATLDPSANLSAGTTYTATVKGGTSGAKDLAGNPLAADVSWSFTTTASANQPPTAVIDSPSPTFTWKVGDSVTFAGHATDPNQGTLPASSLSWTLVMQHCPSNCHTHTIQSWSGVSGGSFSAPDHEYPSYLELTLSATDAGGLTSASTVRLDPQTVALLFSSSPSGLQLTVNAAAATTPFARTVIVGSTNSLSAASPQVLSGTTYEFSGWSDGGAQTHNIAATATSATYTATYVIAPPRNTSLPGISGPARVGRTLKLSNGSWSGSLPMTFSYQWRRCSTTAASSCVPISGATANTYSPTSADIDLYIRATVTASNAGGTGSATSNPTALVKG